MRFYDYKETERDGKAVTYGAADAEREGWPDQLIRERRRGRDEFAVMRNGCHFHKFGSAKPDGEVVLRRKTEYCSDCPFELVATYDSKGGEPIKLTLSVDVSDYVAAEREIKESRARDLAALACKPRAVCARGSESGSAIRGAPDGGLRLAVDDSGGNVGIAREAR